MEKTGIFSANNPNRTGNICAGVGLTLSVALGAALVVLARKFPEHLPSPWTERGAYLVPPLALALVGLRGAILLYNAPIVPKEPKLPPSDKGRAIQERLAGLGLEVELSQDPLDYVSAMEAVESKLNALKEVRYSRTHFTRNWESNQILSGWEHEMTLAECAVDLLLEKLKLEGHATEKQIGQAIFQFIQPSAKFGWLKEHEEAFLIVERMCHTYDEGRRLYLCTEEQGYGRTISPSSFSNLPKYSAPFFTNGTKQNSCRERYNLFCERMEPYLAAALEAEGLERRSVESPWLQPDSEAESSRMFRMPSSEGAQFQKKEVGV